VRITAARSVAAPSAAHSTGSSVAHCLLLLSDIAVPGVGCCIDLCSLQAAAVFVEHVLLPVTKPHVALLLLLPCRPACS
jgi:hypothetical protein